MVGTVYNQVNPGEGSNRQRNAIAGDRDEL